MVNCYFCGLPHPSLEKLSDGIVLACGACWKKVAVLLHYDGRLAWAYRALLWQN